MYDDGLVSIEPGSVAPGATWEDAPAATGGDHTDLLVYVLDYDDLLADEAAVFVLDRLPLTIGRAAADDAPRVARDGDLLRVRDRWASGQHAVIEARGDAVVVRDLGARNGVHVDGRRVSEHRLAPGAVVEVGHSLFDYQRLPAAAAARVLRGARLGPTRTLNAEVAALADAIERIAPTREPVLILGETGTGKEVVAAAIHRGSGRSGPCVTIDCGAIPESLFGATFFGHRRGAFTGAADPRTGEIARADGGTLLIDEIANTSLASQAALLRVIEDGRVTPLGSTDALEVDVRWIAATHHDLFGKPGAFRPDLLARLAGYVARLPPLRARREDLGILAAYLLREAGVTRAAITAPAARVLFAGELPGNVRQLRQALRSAAVLAGEATIDLAHLPPLTMTSDGEPDGVPVAPAAATSTAATAAANDGARRGQPTADEMIAALADSGGNVVRAAESLGTSARQLYRWIERSGIDLEPYRR